MLRAVVTDLAQLVGDSRPAALADEPDAVHQLRTALRRTRNVLAAFRRCFDAEAVAELRGCLASYGDLLGECRDLEVRADHCEGAIVSLGLDDLREPLVVPLLAAHRAAHETVVAWHRGPEVAAIDALLATWSAAPPFAERAQRPAEKVATKAVRKQVERVLRAAHHLDDPDHFDEAHEVRKAARRLRHTADAVSRPPVSVLDGWAPMVGGLGKTIQGMLGDHRDALLLADHVREHAVDVADPAPYLELVAHTEREARHAIGGLAQAILELRDAQQP
jgi:CHAD domain-containing protein